ncbi:DUF4179 domain-containing protein [Clostridium manihotivorum]|uniref:DUF4179 domain-containing protein n=1 Tax=Clostridium manihotivorum TaxID=2320868 RepID=A0A3R5QWQ3_9CLOT|nr:DUF4179 domain-containing protein [Clostridium manihotivorum]QAA34431.1 hypothetical protein C1I91_23870 [Clostridium manihotivorum]
MEEKLFSKFIEREISVEEELKIPDTINFKLNNAYDAIRNDTEIVKKKSHNRKNIAIAASVAFLVLTTVVATPALADNIPQLREISEHLKNIYSYNDNYVSNADLKNISKTYDGIEIAIQGVIYDQSSLKFIYTVTSDKKLQWGVQLRKNSLKINGKEILNKAYSSRIKTEDTKISKDGDKLEKYAVITTFDISDLKLKDKIDIDWNINEIHTENFKFAQGAWDFKVETSKELSDKSSKVLNVNYSRDIEGHKFSIDKIIITPTETKIVSEYDSKFNEEYAKTGEEYLNNVNSKDLQDKLNKLKLIQSQIGVDLMNITDEQGNKIIPYESKIEDGMMTSTFSPFKQMPKKIIITPRPVNDNTTKPYIPSKDEYISLNSLKAPITYNQGDNMTVTINSVERNAEKIKINASFNGDFISARAADAFKVLPNGSTYPEGKIIEDNKDKVSRYIEQANNKNNTFNYQYSVNANQDYNIIISKFDFMKDKQMVFEVK